MINDSTPHTGRGRGRVKITYKFGGRFMMININRLI